MLECEASHKNTSNCQTFYDVAGVHRLRRTKSKGFKNEFMVYIIVVSNSYGELPFQKL